MKVITTVRVGVIGGQSRCAHRFAVAVELNGRPRKSLEFLTPSENAHVMPGMQPETAELFDGLFCGPQPDEPENAPGTPEEES